MTRDERTAAGMAPSAAWPWRRDRADALALWCMVAGAVLLRLAAALASPSVIWPDETFQATEQALRLLTGRGLVPWEFQVGARSWILPGLALPFVAAGRALSGDPRLVFDLIAVAMSLLAGCAVLCAHAIGARIGRAHGLAAAGLVAFWSELVCYGPHLLADTVSGALLLAAVAVGGATERRNRFFAMGLLLGAVLAVRIQLAPAAAVAALLACRLEIRARWAPLAAGAVLPLAGLGLLDWASWGAPFRSTLVYLQTNLGGVADAFGRRPALAYIGEERAIWGPLGTVVVLGCALLGARRAPGPALVAGAVLLTFSLVAHKEQRFIYPALLLVFVLCGIGACELARDLGARLGPRLRGGVLAPALALVWAGASAAAAFSPALQPVWGRNGEILAALERINADPASCGVGVDAPVWDGLGLSRLRDGVQYYPAGETPTAAYDYLLRLPGPRRPIAGYLAAGYAPVGCFGPAEICLYRRPGGCRPGARPLRALSNPDVLAALARQGFRAE